MGTAAPSAEARADTWPGLPLEAWKDTYATLHMWTQIVGKIRLELAPMINHWWQVPLYVTARGLTTSPIPYGTETFQIDFDFLESRLLIETSSGAIRSLALAARPVARFYQEVMDALKSLGISCSISTVPVEVEDRIPFDQDYTHAAYDPGYVQNFWRILLQADRVFTAFRSRFIGKVSPVHFFWGSFDLAVSRFSGRPAPTHPPMPNLSSRVVREAYSHELSSAGFWPGGGPVGEPVFYSYAYPEPAGFRDYPVQPREAYYETALGEFLLPYDAVRGAADPDHMLLTFLQSTYEAAANLGHWDRAALEHTYKR